LFDSAKQTQQNKTKQNKTKQNKQNLPILVVVIVAVAEPTDDGLLLLLITVEKAEIPLEFISRVHATPTANINSCVFIVVALIIDIIF
jgi:hypothetical protein